MPGRQPTLDGFVGRKKTAPITGPLGLAPRADTQCAHGRRRRICVTCTGCVHGTRKSQCRACTPSAFCRHSSRRSTCAVCTGCAHGRRKLMCVECTTVDYRATAGFCVVCSEVRLSDRRRRQKISTCRRCESGAAERPEHAVTRLLAVAYEELVCAALPVPSAADNVLIGGCSGSSRRRPDMCWVAPDRVVHLEIDENSHGGRPIECELAKLDDTNFGLTMARVPTITVRFNPDHAPPPAPAALEDRVTELAALLHALFCGGVAQFCQFRANVTFMFYGPRGAKHISAARAAAESILVFGYSG